MSLNQKALSAYRHGLRATRIAFNGDTRMLLSARAQMREGMMNPDKKLTKPQQIELMEGVAAFLRKNVVQGKNVGIDEAGKNTYELNIHKDTELGDNESIKKDKSTFRASGGGCCGGSGR